MEMVAERTTSMENATEKILPRSEKAETIPLLIQNFMENFVIGIRHIRKQLFYYKLIVDKILKLCFVF